MLPVYLQVVACLILLSHQVHCLDNQATQAFREWAEDHGKIYESRDEAEYREKIFRDNLVEIEQLNEKYRGQTEFAVNQFADMSPKEFREKVLMPRRPAPEFPKDRYMKVSNVDPLPDSFDWTTQGKVTSVKNQDATEVRNWHVLLRNYGGKYKNTVGNIEGQWAMQGKPLTNLSVEQIVDCDSTKDQAEDRADCGVFGGWPFLAYQYVQKAGGLEKEEDYSYCCGIGGGPGSCFPCAAEGYNKTLCGPPVPWCLKNESCEAKLDPKKFLPGLKVIGWKAISENETEIAEALMKYGPLSVALDASRLQFYHRGVYNPFDCSTTELDHAVLIVGFGSEKEFVKIHPYWKVKNSWGEKWGQHGYFKIQRGDGKCGINTQVTTAQLQTGGQ